MIVSEMKESEGEDFRLRVSFKDFSGNSKKQNDVAFPEKSKKPQPVINRFDLRFFRFLG